MIMMMMISMSDLEHLHDVKNKFALLSFLYEDDCSLMGFEILFIFYYTAVLLKDRVLSQLSCL